MSPPNLNFWSISRTESPESQQKFALRNSFCEHYCVQMTFSIPSTIGKRQLERTSILDGVCFNYEQLFHPIQCTACRKCQYSSRGKRA